jgi:hypothetical protein
MWLRAHSEQERHPDSPEALQEVSDKYRIPITPSKRANNIRCTDISAATLSDVDPSDSARKIPKRDRSQQIAPDHYNG